MKIDKGKSKLSTIAVILLLAISTILVALPAVNAQPNLIMNTGTSAIYGSTIDIDLNGPNYQLEGLKFAYKPPGATEFIITTDPPIDNEPGLPGERYVTDAGGDCDIDWTPVDGMGDYEVKWVHPATGAESNVVTITMGAAPELEPYPYINAVPNPIQVNTPTLFHVGSIYPTRRGTGQWAGLTVEVEDPNGGITILPPVETDSTGGTAIQWTPTMVGTYSVRTHFPEQVKTFSDGFTGAAGTIMLESYSDWLEVVVQAEPIDYYPTQGLPTEYWTRPIDGQIREWYTISAPWLDIGEPTSTGPTSMAAPYNEYAPESAHVLFRKPIAMGGLAGGPTGEHGFEQGDAYEGKWNGVVILGGVLFYNQFQSGGGDDVEQVVVAVDLHTGEEKWRRPLVDSEGIVRRLSFAQQFYFDGFNYHGTFGYLFATQGSNWHAFEPQSGRWLFTMEGVPSGTRFRGPNGEILIYSISKNQGTISLWNSQEAIAQTGVQAGSWLWGREGDIFDDVAEDGEMWSITVPEMSAQPGSVYKVRDGIILGSDFSRGSREVEDVHIWCVAVDNVNPELTELLWSITMPPPTPVISIEDVSLEEDLFIMSTKETRQTYGFRLSTGDQLWGPTPSRDYHDIWGHASGNSWDIILGGYNKVIAGNYGGQVWCYNAQTGATEWIYNITDPYTEVLHNNRWRFRPSFYTDGKLYIENTEHNPRDPQPRGAPILCLDIETGELLWQLPYRQGEWSSTLIIGDSIVVAQNTYDQNIYAIGTGPSKTTVEAPLTALTQGESVIIRGTVMDVSPGTTEPAIAIRFPNGVAAVSDDNMQEWMTYVYNQIALRDDVEGVEVKLMIRDPNGEYYETTVTSDGNGVFSHMWAPAVVGEYYVTALFEGSKSYYTSYATTAFGVDQAPAEYPDVPTAEEIAQATINKLPAYPEVPDVPTASEVAQETINRLPAYPEMPEMPEIPEIPAYLTIDLVILVIVAIGLVIGLIAYMTLRKQR
jgi:hypothetical protein